MTGIRIANAPVSYGVFGDLTVDGATTPSSLVSTMAEAGYDGSEIGPPGFFGSHDRLRTAFDDAGIVPVGAYIPLHTQDGGAVLERDLERMSQTLDELVALGGNRLAILADEGDDQLVAHPRHDRVFGLDDAGWDRLVAVVERARRISEERGIATSFHPHIGTYVEQPHEIDRLLASTGVGLTFDVGHIVLGGGDAVASFDAWRSRINHVHVKDVRRAVFDQAVSSGRADFDTWWADLCVPLGEGDLDLGGLTERLVTSGYEGWVVVEQDRAPLTAPEYPAVVAAQAQNLRWLRDRFSTLNTSK
jgi:inosose dehydratase